MLVKPTAAESQGRPFVQIWHPTHTMPPNIHGRPELRCPAAGGYLLVTVRFIILAGMNLKPDKSRSLALKKKQGNQRVQQALSSFLRVQNQGGPVLQRPYWHQGQNRKEMQWRIFAICGRLKLAESKLPKIFETLTSSSAQQANRGVLGHRLGQVGPNARRKVHALGLVSLWCPPKPIQPGHLEPGGLITYQNLWEEGNYWAHLDLLSEALGDGWYHLGHGQVLQAVADSICSTIRFNKSQHPTNQASFGPLNELCRYK